MKPLPIANQADLPGPCPESRTECPENRNHGNLSADAEPPYRLSFSHLASAQRNWHDPCVLALRCEGRQENT